MGTSIFPVSSGGSFPLGVALSSRPAGLVLQAIYTSTTTGITGQPANVFVIMSGGGGAGGSGDGSLLDGAGGSAGSMYMGWIPSFSAVTIGAGGTAASNGGGGGGGGTTFVNNSVANAPGGNGGGGASQPQALAGGLVSTVGITTSGVSTGMQYFGSTALAGGQGTGQSTLQALQLRLAPEYFTANTNVGRGTGGVRIGASSAAFAGVCLVFW